MVTRSSHLRRFHPGKAAVTGEKNRILDSGLQSVPLRHIQMSGAHSSSWVANPHGAPGPCEAALQILAEINHAIDIDAFMRQPHPVPENTLRKEMLTRKDREGELAEQFCPNHFTCVLTDRTYARIGNNIYRAILIRSITMGMFQVRSFEEGDDTDFRMCVPKGPRLQASGHICRAGGNEMHSMRCVFRRSFF